MHWQQQDEKVDSDTSPQSAIKHSLEINAVTTATHDHFRDKGIGYRSALEDIGEAKGYAPRNAYHAQHRSDNPEGGDFEYTPQ